MHQAMNQSNQFPLISTIIPVYNGERFLARAIENVRQQNYHPIEIIVVDDGSTDGTARIATQFAESVRYLYQPNGGPAAARNRGLERAQGGVIAFLDVDDLWPQGKLQAQLQYLVQEPSFDLVWGYTQTVRHSIAINNLEIEEELLPPSLLPLFGSILFRKEVLQRVGYLNEQMRMSEDVDWFMRIREQSVPLKVINQVALIYRLHGQNMTHGKKLLELKTLHAIKNSLDRRRNNHHGVAEALRPLITE
ncbi:MAG: glycosyltransferase family A protein [Caldilineaceae bacterium]